jgi:hypothetical protein
VLLLALDEDEEGEKDQPDEYALHASHLPVCSIRKRVFE